MAEAGLVEVFPIQRSMEVSTCADWCWKQCSGSVECLENIILIASSCDLLDEHRRQTLVSQLAVNGKEIDLAGVDCLSSDFQRDRNTSDGSD